MSKPVFFELPPSDDRKIVVTDPPVYMPCPLAWPHTPHDWAPDLNGVERTRFSCLGVSFNP